MRTHRLKFVCSTVECAKFIEEELLHVDYCDFTHWYCGLDKEGADTPDSCLIYRGIVEPNVIYVEVALRDLNANATPSGELAKYDKWKDPSFWKTHDPAWAVSSITIEELPCYAEMKKAKKELELIKIALDSLIKRKD